MAQVEASTVTAASGPPDRPNGIVERLRRRCLPLFPTSTSAVTWRGAAMAGLAVVVGTLVSLFRQVGAPAWDTVWAEDGYYTLPGAVDDAFLTALSTPISGYYQTLPRLLAEPVAYLPATWAAPVFAVEAATVTALFALVVYVASGAHLRTPLARLAVSAVVLVVPVGADDVPNSLCNLHWPGMYALVWILLWVPRGRAGRVVAVTVAFLVAATNILAVMFLPLALVRAVLGPRGRYGVVLTGALLLGVLPHVIGAFTGVAQERGIPLQPAFADALGTFVTAAVPGGLLGPALLPWAQPLGGSPLLVVGVWALVLAVVVFAVRIARPNRWLAGVMGLHAVVFWLATVGSQGFPSARYGTTTAMFVVAALVALLLPDLDGGRAVPLVALALVLALVWSVNYRQPTARSEGPRWSDEIAVARTACTAPGVERVMVPFAPAYAAWKVELPCRYITQHAK